MFNNPLIHEEAKLKIQERDREAETYGFQQQLGYSERKTARWVVVFLTLVAVMLLILLV